jgi:hypothetical protein
MGSKNKDEGGRMKDEGGKKELQRPEPQESEASGQQSVVL